MENIREISAFNQIRIINLFQAKDVEPPKSILKNEVSVRVLKSYEVGKALGWMRNGESSYIAQIELHGIKDSPGVYKPGVTTFARATTTEVKKVMEKTWPVYGVTGIDAFYLALIKCAIKYEEEMTKLNKDYAPIEITTKLEEKQNYHDKWDDWLEIHNLISFVAN